ncbi:MAG TPA: BamA/TamA family outer membrane protein [Limnochordales bacterium]
MPKLRFRTAERRSRRAGRSALACGLAGALGFVLAATLLWAPWAARAQQAQGQAEPEAAAAPVVRSVVVSGNRRVEASRILDAITHTRPGEPLRRDDVEADLRQILELGYFRSVGVELQELLEPRASGRPPGVRVIFRVEENPPLAGIRLELEPDLQQALTKAGIRLGEPEQLFPGLKPGEPLYGPAVGEELRELTGRVWQEYGVLVQPQEVDLADDGTLVVGLRGVRVGKVLIEGNQKTRENVIRRELTFGPGDILLRSELERSLRRVFMLRFFDDVNADLRPSNPGDHMDVAVKVTERRTGLVQVGMSFSGATGLAGVVEVSDINFQGKGQALELSIQHGELDRRYRFSFTEPYLDSRRTSLSVSVGYQKTRQTAATGGSSTGSPYWDVRYGGELTVGRPLSEYTRAYVTFTNNTWAPEVESGSSLPLGVQPGNLRSVGLALVTDTSDHPFNPTRGNRLRISGQFAGLGGTFTFNKFESSFSHYIPVRWPRSTHVLAFRIGAGHSTGELPDQEWFRLGGSESLRGYDLSAFSGESMMVASLEYRFPVVKPVWGVLFLDAGQVAPQNASLNWTDMKLDAGVGVRIDVPPLGIIRLDYGMTRESFPRFHFSIGQAF